MIFDRMILTVTPNPTIDRVLFVRHFAMQDVVRAEREVIAPSGKGIDVSLLLHAIGAPTHAIALNAGRHGILLAELIADRGLAVDWIAAQGETRMATLVTDVAVGRQSTILAHTLQARPDHLEQMLARIEAHAGNAWGMVSAGSLPPGLPPDGHARILAQAAARGLTTLLDSSGAALVEGVKACPHILKVNAAEFAALMAAQPSTSPSTSSVASHAEPTADPAANGAYASPVPADGDAGLPFHAAPPGDPDLDVNAGYDEAGYDEAGYEEAGYAQSSYESVLRLAEQIAPTVGVWAREAVVVTLGRNGILAVTADSIHHAPALPVPVVSPAGAGDAVSAGIMLARSRGDDWETALLWASALAAAVVSNAGTAECTRAQVMALLEEATVVELDASP